MKAQQILCDHWPDHPCAGDSIAIAAQATSGLPVKMSIVSGPAVVADNRVTFVRPGEVKLRISQGGNDEFEAAPDFVVTFNVSKANQTIIVEPLPAEIFSGDRIVIKAAASSQLPVSFRVLSGPARLTGWQVAIVSGPGTVEIEASQAGNDKIGPTKVIVSFTAIKRSQEIRFVEAREGRFTDPGFAFKATSTSGLPVSLSIVSGRAQIRDSELILTSAGPVEIRATQLGDSCYSPVELVQTFVAPKRRQTIVFDAAPGRLSVGDVYTLHASATSGLPVKFEIVEGQASLAGDRVTPESPGIITIKAAQAGDDNHEPAEAVRHFTVGKARQKLAFKAFPKEIFVGDHCTLEAVATSGLGGVSFSVISGKATISGQQLALTGPGPAVIKAAHGGNERFEPAEAEQSIVVLKARQTVHFDGLPNEVSVGDSLPLRATAASGLPVGISVVSGPAEITDGQLTVRGAGEIKVKASQSGDENYAAAPEVVHTLTAVKVGQIVQFDPGPEEIQIGEPLALGAAATSGQPVVFRVLSGPGELKGNALFGTGAGRVEIEAEQVGDDKYVPAKNQRSLRIIKRSQQIQFEQPPERKVGDPAFGINAKSTSGLPVTFSVVSGPAQIRNSEIAVTGAGRVELKAMQAGDATYVAAEKTCSFSVAKGQQTVRFDAVAGAASVGDTYVLQARSSSGLPVTFSVIEGKASLGGNRLTPEAAGSLRIKATQEGNHNYEPAEALQSLSVIKAAQTLTFKALPKEIFFGDRCTLEAVASSGIGPFSFSVASGQATIDGNQLTLTSAGAVVIRATQAGNERFEAAEAEQGLTVLKAKQTIRFEGLPLEATVGESFPVRATAASGLPVGIGVHSGPAEIIEGRLTLHGAGEVKIKANQPGDDNHAPAPQVFHTLKSLKVGQAIQFDLGCQELQIGEPVLLTAAATSAQPVTFRVVSGHAELKGNTLVGNGAGRVELEAEQAGDVKYLPAKVQRSLQVIKRSQQIQFDEFPLLKVGDSPCVIGARATSGLPISFRVVSGPAKVKNNQVTPSGAGPVEIKASQAGDGTFAAADATFSFAIGKGPQTVAFDTVPSAITVGDPYTLQASASSGLPVIFSVVAGNASLAGNRLTAEGAGPLTIKTTQAGNENYEPAETVQNIIAVKARQTLNFKPLPKEIFFGDRCNLEAVASSGLGAVSFNVVSGKASVSGSELILSGAGPVVIKAAQAGNERFEAIETEQSVTVLKGKQTIRFDGLPGEASVGESFPIRATASSGLPVSISVLSGLAEIAGDQLRLHGAGEVKLKATQPGDENHAPAPELVRTLTAVKEGQTLRFDLSCEELRIGESMVLSAAAGSGQPVRFRLVSGPAELKGNTLVATGAGRVEIEAEQGGDTKYLPAKAQRSVLVIKRSQEIRFEPLNDRKVGEPPFTIGARATSGLPITFTVVSGPAQIRNNKITLSGAGRVEIEAAQAGDSTYAAVEAVCSFVVGKGRQTIRFNSAPETVNVGDVCTFQASASSGLPVTFSIRAGRASLSGNRLTSDAPGTLTIKATQKGNEHYEAAEAEHCLTIIKVKQTLEFKALPKELYVGDRCALEALASSGVGGISFSVVSGNAAIDGQQLKLTNAGPLVIKAAHAGNEKVDSAEAEQSILVHKAKQTIRFDGLPREASAGESIPIRATAGSGLPVSITLVSGPAEIVDGQLILHGAGEVKIKASQLGDENNSAAPDVVHALSAVRASQTIRFDLGNDTLQIGEELLLSATATSGQPVKFRLLSGPAELKGNTLVGTGAGRVEIEAEQLGDAKNAAIKTQRSLEVVKRSQEIQFAELRDERFEDPRFLFKATSTSGLPVSLSVVSGEAQIGEEVVTLIGAGPVRIKATQSGDNTYGPTEVIRSFATPKRRQTVVFDVVPEAVSVGDTCTLQARATSGLPVTFSVVAGRGRLAGDRLTPDTTGALTIKAAQAGNENYQLAEAVQTLMVVKATQNIDFKALPREIFVGDQCTLEAVASSRLQEITFSVVAGRATISGKLLKIIGSGSVVIRAAQSGNEKFEPAESEQSLEVLKAKQTIRFELPREASVGESLQLRAVTGSGLPVSVEVLSGPAEIVDGQLVLRGAGEIKIKARQSGDENYATAPEIVHTLTAAKAKQTIRFDLASQELQIGESMVFAAVASSGQPITFRLISGRGELNGSTLVATGAGRVEIEAEQPGNDRYLEAKIQRALQVVKRSQEVRLEPLPDRKVGAPNFVINGTATSGLPVSFSVVSGPAQIRGNEVILNGAGLIKIKAVQAGDDTYTAAEALSSFSVGKSQQTVRFEAMPEKVMVGESCAVQASAGSGLAVSISVVGGKARLAGNRVTPETVGIVKIRAKQAGNENYEPAEAEQSLTVVKAKQTLEFKPFPKELSVGDCCNLEAKASSGLGGVSFSVVSGKATLSGHQLTLTGAGTVVIKATQGGDEKFEAVEAKQSLSVQKAKQTISFEALPSEAAAGESFPVRATADSGLPVSFRVVSGPGEIGEGQLKLRGAGEVKIKASQSGNDDYAAAPDVVHTLNASKARQTIRFDLARNELQIGDAVLLTAAASSGQLITFRLLSGPAELFGDSLVGTGAGKVEVEAEQVGNAKYLPTKVQRSLEVIKRPQSILLDPLQTRKVGEQPFNISAKATSGLPVNLAIVSGPASISGTEVSLSGRGKVRIVASQPGDDRFQSAPEVEGEFDAKAPMGKTWAVVAGVLSVVAILVAAFVFWPSRHSTPNSAPPQVQQTPQAPSVSPSKPTARELVISQSISNAAALLKDGKLEEAGQLIDKVLQERPGDAAALALKAQITANRDEAAKVKEFQLAMQLAQKAESDQKWPEAVDLLKQALLRASSLKDTNYAQPLASELSYANNMVAAQNALSQANYQEAINRADAALTVKANDASASKIKTEAQNAKQYQDAFKLAQDQLTKGNYSEAIKQADTALRFKAGDPQAAKIKQLAQQEQTYRAATAAFKQGDYAAALNQSQQFKGTDRFDRLSNQIGQEQNQLKVMQKALSDGNYADILTASLPGKPAFDNIKAAATEEDQVLKQAHQKLAAKDYSYIETIQQQSYASKAPFAAILEEGQKALEALKNQQKSNVVVATVPPATLTTAPQTVPDTTTPSVPSVKTPSTNQTLVSATTPTNAAPNASATHTTRATPVTAPPITPATTPSTASSTSPATTLTITKNDRLLEYWEILFSIRPRPAGSDVRPLRDPTKDSAYNLEQFDKVEAEYSSLGALDTDRKRRINALRWVVSGGKKGETSAFGK